MVPAQFVAGVSSCLVGFLLSTKLMISPNDIFLGFLAGFFQVGFGFIFITIGARTTPSAIVGVIMLSESVLGPIWAFLFVSERPSLFGIIGGAIILFAVLLQFYSLLIKNKKSVSN
jgi:drug/metabolite transporter (DMT)-like permease